MHNEIIYKKKLFINIKKSLLSIKGVNLLNLSDRIFKEYKDLQPIINSFYSYESKGEKIITCCSNNDVEKIIKYLNQYLNYIDTYYVSYEDMYFLEFKFTNFLDFIKSWKEINHNYDLTVFNAQKIFTINDNEYDITIHYHSI